MKPLLPAILLTFLTGRDAPAQIFYSGMGANEQQAAWNLSEAKHRLHNALTDYNNALENESNGMTPENGWYGSTPSLMQASAELTSARSQLEHANILYESMRHEAVYERQTPNDETDLLTSKPDIDFRCHGHSDRRESSLNNTKTHRDYDWPLVNAFQNSGIPVQKQDQFAHLPTLQNTHGFVLDPPTNGSIRCFTELPKESMLKISSKSDYACYVQVLSAPTNGLAKTICDVYVAPKSEVKVPMPLGKYRVRYKTGTLWQNPDVGFVVNHDFEFPRAYLFLRNKGIHLKIHQPR